MPDPDFDTFRSDLLRRGVTPSCALRISDELREHYEDLVSACVEDGDSPAEASRRAAAALGRMDDLAAEVEARRELKTWVYRYPRAAIVVYPLACLVVLPATPVIAGVAHAPVLARWGLSLVAAAAFTASLLLLLQLSILFG